ncbi:hypothetical protein FM114_04670 [Luteococcus japonicus LSP_Lj1]|uniref:Uncharacterized protein n=1 Tax=Luteococcus japonicus LSP_Lj1 TaxID=1255658 RepID=A0A1R4IZT0_9ACTN|nr:hypothetical protein FM114_04670 [Luteococcus japonicus LSP_Lj1]
MCRECGDLGCGALTVNIERSGQMVRWNQFGWDGSHHEEPYSAIEFPLEFTFEAASYDATLHSVGERVLASQRQSAAMGHLWWREPGFAMIDL